MRYSPGADRVVKALKRVREPDEEYFYVGKAVIAIMDLLPDLLPSVLARALHDDQVWEPTGREQHWRAFSGLRRWKHLELNRQLGPGLRLGDFTKDAETRARGEGSAFVHERHLAAALARDDMLRPLGINGIELLKRVKEMENVRILEWFQNHISPSVAVNWGIGLVPFTEGMPPEPAIGFWAYNFGSVATTLTSFLYGVPSKNISAPVPSIRWGGDPILKTVPPFPVRLEPGGTVMAFWNLQDLKQAGVEPPYASVGFRDARGRVYYCVGGLRGWWLRWRARHWGR